MPPSPGDAAQQFGPLLVPPPSMSMSSRPRSQRWQGGQDQPSCFLHGWPCASASPIRSLALRCPAGPAAPRSPATSRAVTGLGWAPVPARAEGQGEEGVRGAC